MRRMKLFWGSSYDRGLEYLLYMWSDIRKKYEDAELHICYGWDLFDKAYNNNPERQQWKKVVSMLMEQEGIFHHGRVGKEELGRIRKECGIWAYTTNFDEINCITALECQRDGLVPVVINRAALKETVGSGIKLENLNINDINVQDEYKNQLLNLMGDESRWLEESQKAREFAKGYEWENVAKKWDEVFKEEVRQPLVSVITITIREGFWNIMAHNLSNQNYRNFEWIIVDDYKKDRSEIAKKYAKDFNLNIRYYRGDKALEKYSRPCAIARSNNIGWKKAEGELLVWLQDFILVPFDGITKLVNLYNHNPRAIIAPVDVRYSAKEANLDNREDWWDGETKVLINKEWANPRVINEGIRESENPFEFEMNYAVIPKYILSELNGFYEFLDDGIGYDNTEIADRAMRLGYKLLVDDTNICYAINIWPMVGGKPQNVVNRERILNTPRYVWLSKMFKEGKMPVIRDEVIDANLKLEFKVPDEIPDKDAVKWINNEDNILSLLRGWEKCQPDMKK